MYHITAVSYLNTYPLIYGLRHFFQNDPAITLETAVPSEVARRLINRRTHIGLVPVAELPQIPESQIISNFCIGADGPVRTVLLRSKKPLNDIRQIHLDTDSRTSVNLCRVLAREFWNISPQWKKLRLSGNGSTFEADAIVIIGDKTFRDFPEFPFVYDLAAEWKKFTGLPFVFAVWSSNCPLSRDFCQGIDDAQQFGLNHIHQCLKEYELPVTIEEAGSYLHNNISFKLDIAKRKALQLFLNYLQKPEA